MPTIVRLKSNVTTRPKSKLPLSLLPYVPAIYRIYTKYLRQSFLTSTFSKNECVIHSCKYRIPAYNTEQGGQNNAYRVLREYLQFLPVIDVLRNLAVAGEFWLLHIVQTGSWLPEFFFLWVTPSNPDVDHKPSPSAAAMNKWSYTSARPT